MVTITSLFWNSDEARLRAGWRIVVFLLGAFVLGEALSRLGRPVLTRLLPLVYSNAVEAAIYLLLIGGPLMAGWQSPRSPLYR